jgi:hypothetical protein
MVVLRDSQFKYHGAIRISTKEHPNYFIRSRANKVVPTVGVGDTGASEFNSDILHIREVDTDVVNKSGNNDEDVKNISLCGGGLEHLHRSPAISRRRRKGNPVPGGLTGPACHWGTQIQGPGPPGWGLDAWLTTT